MTLLAPTDRTRLNRARDRASYDRATIHAILDSGLVCHVGFAIAGQPYVVPTSYGRDGDALIVHGAAGGRMVRALAGGAPLCVEVSAIDGLVLARSAYHHSVNYRSVVIVGSAVEITDLPGKIAALRILIEHATPGRWRHVRPPSARELRAVGVLRIPIVEASAKIRTGPPIDDADDYALPHWAGEIPLRLAAGAPIPDPRLSPDTPRPDHLTAACPQATSAKQTLAEPAARAHPPAREQ